MKKIIVAVILITCIASCSKNNPSPDTGSFTPPTSNYLILDTKEHDSASGRAVYETMIPDFDITNASFTNPALTPPIISVQGFSLKIEALVNTLASQNPYTRDMHDSIPEGGFVKYTLAGVDGGAHKQGFWMYATMVVSETYTNSVGSVSGGDGYYLTGSLYISKLNGKLRYTTDGTVTVTNSTHTFLTHSVKFSVAEDAGTF